MFLRMAILAALCSSFGSMHAMRAESQSNESHGSSESFDATLHQLCLWEKMSVEISMNNSPRFISNYCSFYFKHKDDGCGKVRRLIQEALFLDNKLNEDQLIRLAFLRKKRSEFYPVVLSELQEKGVVIDDGAVASVDIRSHKRQKN